MSNAPQRPESNVATMMRDNAIFAARRPDKPRHQPKFKGVPVIWRNGKEYYCIKGGLLPVRAKP